MAFRSAPIRLGERCRRSAVFLGMQPEVKAKEENTPKDVQNPAIFSKPCNFWFRWNELLIGFDAFFFLRVFNCFFFLCLGDVDLFVCTGVDSNILMIALAMGKNDIDSSKDHDQFGKMFFCWRAYDPNKNQFKVIFFQFIWDTCFFFFLWLWP